MYLQTIYQLQTTVLEAKVISLCSDNLELLIHLMLYVTVTIYVNSPRPECLINQCVYRMCSLGFAATEMSGEVPNVDTSYYDRLLNSEHFLSDTASISTSNNTIFGLENCLQTQNDNDGVYNDW